MKRILFILTLFINSSLSAQSLANTFWQVYNPSIQAYKNYKFSATKLGYADVGTTYTDIALYFESGNNFKIVDLPPPACSDTGYYTFSNTSDLLDFTVNSDLCLPRQNFFNNFLWYKAGTVALPLISREINNIYISPNPTENLIYLHTTNMLPGTPYTIIDLMGKEVFRGKTEFEITSILLQDFPGGIYVLQIGEGKNKSLRIAKQ